MKALIPSYYKDFSCIGPACEDTCCKGWQVTIDEKTYKKYRDLPSSPLKQKLDQSVKRNESNLGFFDYSSMKMDHGACPLLTNEGYCQIHAELGNTYLSHTCSTYPRQFNQVEGLLEISTTLSCPETARLALLNENGIQFEEVEIDEALWSEYARKQNTPTLRLLRTASIRLLQNRTTSIENRLTVLGLFLQKVNSIQNMTSKEFEQLISQYEARLINKTFLNQLENLPLQTDFQLKIMTDLAKQRHLGSHVRFNQCLTEVIEALQLDTDIPHKEKIHLYKQAISNEYTVFIGKYEYVWENYLVNHMFKNMFPFDEKTLFASFRKMVTYFILIKFQLIGMAKYRNELSSNDVVFAFQSFARATEHNILYVDSLLNAMEEQGFNTIGSLVTLIRH